MSKSDDVAAALKAAGFSPSTIKKLDNGVYYAINSVGDEIYYNPTAVHDGETAFVGNYPGWGGSSKDAQPARDSMKSSNPPDYSLIISSSPHPGSHNILEKMDNFLDKIDVDVNGVSVVSFSASGDTGFHQLNTYLGNHNVNNASMLVVEGSNVKSGIVTPGVAYKHLIDQNVPIYALGDENHPGNTGGLKNLGYNVARVSIDNSDHLASIRDVYNNGLPSYLLGDTDTFGNRTTSNGDSTSPNYRIENLGNFIGRDFVSGNPASSVSGNTGNTGLGIATPLAGTNEQGETSAEQLSTPLTAETVKEASSDNLVDNASSISQSQTEHSIVEKIALSEKQYEKWNNYYNNGRKVGEGRLITLKNGDYIYIPKNLKDGYNASVLIPAGGSEGQYEYRSSAESYIKNHDLNGIVYFVRSNNASKDVDGILTSIERAGLYKGASNFTVTAMGGSFGGPPAVEFQIKAAERGHTGAIVLFDPSAQYTYHSDGRKTTNSTDNGTWNNGLDYRFSAKDLKLLKDNNIPIIIYDTNTKNRTTSRYLNNLRRLGNSGITIYYATTNKAHADIPSAIISKGVLRFFSGDKGSIGDYQYYKFDPNKGEKGGFVEVTDLSELRAIVKANQSQILKEATDTIREFTEIDTSSESEDEKAEGKEVSDNQNPDEEKLPDNRLIGTIGDIKGKIGSILGLIPSTTEIPELYKDQPDIVKANYQKVVEYANRLKSKISYLENFDVTTLTGGSSTTQIPAEEAVAIQSYLTSSGVLINHLAYELTMLIFVSLLYEDMDSDLAVNAINNILSGDGLELPDEPYSGGGRRHSGGANSLPASENTNPKPDNSKGDILNPSKPSKNTLDDNNAQKDKPSQDIDNSKGQNYDSEVVISHVNIHSNEPTNNRRTSQVRNTYRNVRQNNVENLYTNVHETATAEISSDEIPVDYLDTEPVIFDNNNNVEVETPVNNNSSNSNILGTLGIAAASAAAAAGLAYGLHKYKKNDKNNNDNNGNNEEVLYGSDEMPSLEEQYAPYVKKVEKEDVEVYKSTANKDIAQESKDGE